MSPGEILKRLEEIGADAARGISNPDTDVWLCRVVRELAARLERLERVVEAAEVAHDLFVPRRCSPCSWSRS